MKKGCLKGWGGLFATFCIGVLLTLILPPALIAAFEAIIILIICCLCFFKK